MQRKWVIGAAVSTLSIGVIGVTAAFAAGQEHLNDQSGVTIAEGVQGESTSPLINEAWQRTGFGGATNETSTNDSANNSADDGTQSNQHTTNQQTNKPVQTQTPAPVVAPPPEPQSVSSISAD